MVWYANHWVGAAMFLPMGLLGGLLPHLGIRENSEASGTS
jgi:hypothetical protein